MPRARFHSLDPEKQAQILEAAAEEFAAHGYEGASYNQIIEKIGVSKGAMYYYFDNKLDLFAAVMHREVRVLEEVWAEGLGGPELDEDFWGAFERMARAQARMAVEHPRMMALARSMMELGPAALHEPPLSDFYVLTRGWLERIMAKGQELGAVRRDLPFDLLIEALQGLGEGLDRWGLAHWDELDEAGMERMTDISVELFRRLVEPRP